jgi:hypothetical protein
VGTKGISDAISLVLELIVPWKRDHAKEMARLHEQQAQADVLETRARAAKGRAEEEKIQAEAEKSRAEARQIEQNLHKDAIELALEVLDSFSDQLTLQEKGEYLNKLLPPLDKIISSPYQVTATADHVQAHEKATTSHPPPPKPLSSPADSQPKPERIPAHLAQPASKQAQPPA